VGHVPTRAEHLPFPDQSTPRSRIYVPPAAHAQRHDAEDPAMSKVKATAHANFPAQRFVDALTDFGPDRGKIWGNSSPSKLQVHDRGETWADVTEGTAASGIWQRYRYDWSTPGLVRLDVLDSNSFGQGSFWEYRLTEEAPDRTRIDLLINRVPTTAWGKFTNPSLVLFGRMFFTRSLKRTIKRLDRQAA
jgi:hypothetical protein